MVEENSAVGILRSQAFPALAVWKASPICLTRPRSGTPAGKTALQLKKHFTKARGDDSVDVGDNAVQEQLPGSSGWGQLENSYLFEEAVIEGIKSFPD
ncbi:MAG: hypothetical protein ABFS02_07340 [Pseudomonadota bacterium]